MGRPFIAMIAALLLAAGPGAAERTEAVVGGDILVSGGRLDETSAASRDLLVSGAQIVLRGDVAEDIFAAGLAVDVEGAAGGDVSASGARVRLDGQVGGDATLSGFIVTLDDDARIGGNARVFAGTATHRGAVDGSLVMIASEIRLDGLVRGDVHILAGSLSFGPDARVEGRLVLALPEEVVVPPEVAPSGRVSYRRVDVGNWGEFDEFEWEGMPDAPSAGMIGGGFLLVLAFLLVTGVIFLALMPRSVATMRRMALNRPGVTMLVGAVGLSCLFGLVPVSVISVIGLPLLPLAILLVLVGWTLGYLLGAYVIAMGIARAAGLGDMPGILARILVLGAAILVAALLNFVPVVGWILNMLLVFFGLGAMTEAVLRAVMPSVDADPDNEMSGAERS